MGDPDKRTGLRPRSVGELLTDAFEVYRRNFATLIAIAAVVVVPTTILQYFLTQQVFELGTPISPEGELLVEASDLWALLISGLVVGVISFVIGQLAVGAGTHAVAGAIVGRRPTVGESYRAALGRLGSILLVAVLTGLAVFAGFLLLVIPGIIVLVRLAVAVPAVVIEGKRGGEALSRSWNLVRGSSWKVFGAAIVAFLIVGIFSAILTGPFADEWVSQGIAAAAASVLTMPYVLAVIVLIYLDLRVRSEELDEAMLGQQLESRSP